MIRLLRRTWNRLCGLATVVRLVVGVRFLRSRSNKDVLILTMPNPDRRLVLSLREELNALGIDLPMICLRKGVHIHIATEDEMRRAGWQRAGL